MSNLVQHVAITRADGSVAVMSFLTRGRGNVLPKGAKWSAIPGYWEREASDENVFSEISRTFAASDVQPVGYRLIPEAEIPTDRSFRNAWKDDGAKITHDMPKAREIHLERLKRKRVVELEQLDRDWMRAYAGKKQKEADDVEAKRQAWRDMPVTVATALEAAQDVEALKAVTFSA